MKKNRAEYQRRWRRENPVSNKLSQRKYYLKNKAKMDAYQREWKKLNREKIALKRKSTRKAKRLINPNIGKEEYANHRDSILKAQLKRRSSNREKYRAIGRFFYYKHKANRIHYAKIYASQNKETIARTQKCWRANNKPHIRAYYKNRIANNLLARIRHRISSNINKVLNRSGSKKSCKTAILLGCSTKRFKEHIESQFLDGMSWDNRSEWHIDHIRPCASFDLSDPEQQKACFHHTNLRPVWPVENLKKSSFWKGVLFRPSRRSSNITT